LSQSRDDLKFWEINDNNWKMVQDRCIVSVKVKYDVIYAQSNGYVADDLG